MISMANKPLSLENIPKYNLTNLNNKPNRIDLWRI